MPMPMTMSGLSGLDALQESDLHAALIAQLGRIDPAVVGRHLAPYAAALARGDGHVAADLLIHRFGVAGTAYRLLAVYALTVLVVERPALQGRMFAGREYLLRTIRQQIRCELARLPPGEAILWLIPATSEERTAAHAAALIFACAGATARPWLWPGTPQHGSFRIIAAAGALRGAAGKGCLGISDFAALVLPALRSIPPVATLRG